MLNKSEKEVLQIVYEKCNNQGSCLITINQIKAQLKHKNISEQKIKSAVKSLQLDNYYDLILCEKNGEQIYCINLLKKGYSFKRETQQNKRMVVSKIIFAIITGVITFLVGRMLIYFFN